MAAGAGVRNLAGDGALSLKDKLKPDTKQRVGKIAPCPKCGRDAEHYSANYIACERCDSPTPKKAAPAPKPILGDFGEDIDTNPGWSTTQRFYTCQGFYCGVESLYFIDSVAAGQTCRYCTTGKLVAS